MTTLAGSAGVCSNPTSACGDGGPASGAQFNNPSAIATDKNGNIYIADTGDNRIRVINLQGSTITVTGVSIPSGQNATIVGPGNVWWSPTAPCGDNGRGTSANLNAPRGVTAERNGYVGVSDTGDHRVRGVTPQGIMIGYAGNGNICNPSVGC